MSWPNLGNGQVLKMNFSLKVVIFHIELKGMMSQAIYPHSVDPAYTSDIWDEVNG